MAYSDDAVLAKLSALTETQDSIVGVAQWIMFHRRHADRTVQLWLQRLKDSSSHKRLNLIYLANEISQQSKARNKEEFLVAISPTIAEAVATAYKGAPTDVQQRIRRVIDVWRERNVFEVPIQDAVENRLQELDKARGTNKAGLGGAIFGSSPLPSELAPLATPQQSVTKLSHPAKTAVSSANQEYDKLMGPDAVVPSAPVYAARLSGLLKTLAQAEGAVEQCVKARRTLVSELQKLLDTNRSALLADEAQMDAFERRRAETEDRKTEVERAIMAGLPPDEPYISVPHHGAGLDGGNDDPAPAPEPDRPEVEALTPPSAEPDSPGQQQEQEPAATALPDMGMLSSLAARYGSGSGSVPASAANGSKKRRLDNNDDFPDIGVDGIDADVAETLRRDSSGGI